MTRNPEILPDEVETLAESPDRPSALSQGILNHGSDKRNHDLVVPGKHIPGSAIARRAMDDIHSWTVMLDHIEIRCGKSLRL